METRDIDVLRIDTAEPVRAGAVVEPYMEGREVPVLLVGNDNPDITARVTELGLRPSGFRAVPVQSKGTFLVWDPLRRDRSPFFIKTAAGPSGPESVLMTSLVWKALQRERDPPVRILPEVRSIQMQARGREVNLVYRTAGLLPRLPDEGHYVPAHGILNSSFSPDAQNRKLHEFVPYFARACAFLNQKLGFYSATHLQNSLIALSLNSTNPSIIAIGVQDMADTSWDPAVRFSETDSRAARALELPAQRTG